MSRVRHFRTPKRTHARGELAASRLCRRRPVRRRARARGFSRQRKVGSAFCSRGAILRAHVPARAHGADKGGGCCRGAERFTLEREYGRALLRGCEGCGVEAELLSVVNPEQARDRRRAVLSVRFARPQSR
jgi:hypothetical protein